MNVYFLRHASAGKSKADPEEDARRPLDEEGIEQAKLMGRVLKAIEIEVDVIVTSPLTRAKQTAKLAAQEMGCEVRVTTDDAMRPDATTEDFQRLLKKHDTSDSIIVVGHNPSQTEFLNSLVTGKEAGRIELKKGAVAKIGVNENENTLYWLITPKLVAQIQSATSSRPKIARK